MSSVAVTPAEGRPPADTVALGLRLFIISLSVLFGALLYAYFVARTGRWDHVVTSGTSVPSIQVPVWFWFSTFVILVSSITLFGAWRAARASQSRWSARGIRATALLGYLFVALQVPGFMQIIARHRVLREQHVLVYGLVIVIAGLHALHVLGGLIPLTRLALRAARFPFDATRDVTLRHMGTYWHFLSVVWWAIFTAIVIAD